MKIKYTLIFATLTLLSVPLFSQPCTVSISATSNSVCPGFQSTLTAFGATSYTWLTSSGPVVSQTIAGGAGTYSVAGTSGTCVASASFTVGVAPPLSISVTPAGAVTCITSNNPKFSKAVTFTASGASSYVWFPYNPVTMTYSLGPTTTVRPPVSTCYTVTGYTSICSGSAVVCVTVIPQFTIAVTPAQTTVCVGDGVGMSVSAIGTLAAGPSSSFTYSWSETNGPSLSAPLSSVTAAMPTENETYTVEVRDADNCVSEPQHVAVFVEACAVGLANVTASSVKVFPNPSNDIVNVRSEKFLSAMSFQDIQGSNADAPLFFENGDAKIRLEQLAPGLYFLKLGFTDGSNCVIKIIRN